MNIKICISFQSNCLLKKLGIYYQVLKDLKAVIVILVIDQHI